MPDPERDELDDWADTLALLFARNRTGGDVYMDGSSDPTPTERAAARRFMQDLASAGLLQEPQPAGECQNCQHGAAHHRDTTCFGVCGNYTPARRAADDEERRCNSCEHRADMHGVNGCQQEIHDGPGDEPVCCHRRRSGGEGNSDA